MQDRIRVRPADRTGDGTGLKPRPCWPLSMSICRPKWTIIFFIFRYVFLFFQHTIYRDRQQPIDQGTHGLRLSQRRKLNMDTRHMQYICKRFFADNILGLFLHTKGRRMLPRFFMPFFIKKKSLMMNFIR